MTFRCPLCRATVYEELVPGTAGRGAQRLYACAGCTLVFVDPARLSRPRGGMPGQPVASPDFSRVHTPTKVGPQRPRTATRSRRAPA
jgi:hypothetical protein